MLAGPAGDHPWPAEVSSRYFDQFGAHSPTRLTLITPVVVEVMADVAWSGRAFRHALRYLRPRPDIDPADVTPPER